MHMYVYMAWILSSCVINCLYAFWRNLWASRVQSKGKNIESGTRLEGRGYEEHHWLPAPSSPLLDPAFLALPVNSLPSELVSVQFSCSVVSDSLWLHGLQHTKLACPSPTPRACSDSCPSSHDDIMCSDAIQPSHPLFPPSPLALNLSQHRVFSSESDLGIRWPKYWSFSFCIRPSNEYSGFISFRINLFDLPVQGTLKSLLQHHTVQKH